MSKVFGVIDRFSEDIDLCLVPEFVGADAAGFDALTSRVKRDAAVLQMQRLCADNVQQLVLPLLEGAIVDTLGPRLQVGGCITSWMRMPSRPLQGGGPGAAGHVHRPTDSPTPDRYAQHCFDMVRLLAHNDAPLFWARRASITRPLAEPV